MVKIGLTGIGFMGMTHYQAVERIDGGEVVAICSRDKKKLAGDWTSVRGNFGEPGGHVDLAGVKKYEAYAELLADPDVDLVDVCLPNGLHADAAIAALEAGKHVLVEKPIALTVEDADRMLAAAEAAGKLLMVAHVLPFFPEFAFAAGAVQSGRFGKLLAATFKRVISRADWSAGVADPGSSGGPAIDLHVHDTHFVGLLAGVPDAVFATGHIENGTVRHLSTQYLYGPDGPSVTAVSGDLCRKGREFVHGFEIYCERATLLHESGVTPLTVLHADGSTETPELPGGGDPVGAFAAELTAAVSAVASGEEPPLLSGKLARDALVMCHRECDSARTGQAAGVE